jgi:hypothetical protein
MRAVVGLSFGLLLAVAVPVAAMPAADAARSVVRPALEIRMQIEGNAPLETTDLKAIAADIRRIWAPLLDVVVTLPTDASRGGAVDSIPLVITRRTLDAAESSGLGWIAFVDSEPQPQITVSVAIAERMLQTGTWRGVSFATKPPFLSRLFLRRALACAAAHEIGHYLLRTRAHARHGLMRPVFTIDEIMDGRSSLTRLDPVSRQSLDLSPQIASRQSPND